MSPGLGWTLETLSDFGRPKSSLSLSLRLDGDEGRDDERQGRFLGGSGGFWLGAWECGREIGSGLGGSVKHSAVTGVVLL